MKPPGRKSANAGLLRLAAIGWEEKPKGTSVHILSTVALCIVMVRIGAESVVRTEEFEQLFREVSPRLWRSIYVYAGGSRHIADDAVAEAFALAIANRRSIRTPVPWLYRVAFRAAARELKIRQGNLPAHDDPSHEEDPLQRISVLSALAMLSPSQRASVYLHYQGDMAIRDIAKLMGKSPVAIRTHIARGRSKLRVLLAEEDMS